VRKGVNGRRGKTYTPFRRFALDDIKIYTREFRPEWPSFQKYESTDTVNTSGINDSKHNMCVCLGQVTYISVL